MVPPWHDLQWVAYVLRAVSVFIPAPHGKLIAACADVLVALIDIFK